MPAYVIGIGGGSAAGKSATAEELQRRLAPLTVQVINQDRYFRKGDDLPTHLTPSGRVWRDHNHPDSFDFARLRTEAGRAREGGLDVLVIEGILVLHDPELRGLMDLKLFVNADPDERIVRRIRRNVARGASLDEVCDFYLDSVRYRHDQFCEPTRSHADLIIPGGVHEAEERDRLLCDVCTRVNHAIRPSVGRSR
ncbi:MAG: uridine kinase [Armatimonadota bacterium]